MLKVHAVSTIFQEMYKTSIQMLQSTFSVKTREMVNFIFYLQLRRFYLIVPILTCKSVIAHFCKMFIAAKLKFKKKSDVSFIERCKIIQVITVADRHVY